MDEYNFDNLNIGLEGIYGFEFKFDFFLEFVGGG